MPVFFLFNGLGVGDCHIPTFWRLLQEVELAAWLETFRRGFGQPSITRRTDCT